MKKLSLVFSLAFVSTFAIAQQNGGNSKVTPAPTTKPAPTTAKAPPSTVTPAPAPTVSPAPTTNPAPVTAVDQPEKEYAPGNENPTSPSPTAKTIAPKKKIIAKNSPKVTRTTVQSKTLQK